MVDRGSRRVRRMFASVADRYDLLNRVLSLSIDRIWRRRARRRVLRELPDHPRVLDLCTGTGDVALEFAPYSRVIGCDFCRPMLKRAVSKTKRSLLTGRLSFVEGDAHRLSFPSDRFDAVTIAFGLRNLERREEGLREMWRVLKPGGILVILEFAVPPAPGLRQLYLVYFTKILPFIGRLVSGREGPYSYLPESVREFPSPERLVQLLKDLDFENIARENLTFGIAVLYLARKSFPAVGNN